MDNNFDEDWQFSNISIIIIVHDMINMYKVAYEKNLLKVSSSRLYAIIFIFFY